MSPANIRKGIESYTAELALYQDLRHGFGLNPDRLTSAIQSLLIAERSRVFLLHTKCCDKCNWVTNCLGFLLNSTGMMEVVLDMWNMHDIAPNVARWYEDQIRSNEYVVVLVSHEMSLRTNRGSQNEDRKCYTPHNSLLWRRSWMCMIPILCFSVRVVPIKNARGIGIRSFRWNGKNRQPYTHKLRTAWVNELAASLDK